MDKGTSINLIKQVETKPPKSKTQLKLEDKIKRLEKMVLRIKRADDLFNVCGLSLFTQVYLPSKFKILEIDKFGGTRCPTTHLKMYIRVLYSIGISEDLMAQLFQQLLLVQP